MLQGTRQLLCHPVASTTVEVAQKVTRKAAPTRRPRALPRPPSPIKQQQQQPSNGNPRGSSSPSTPPLTPAALEAFLLGRVNSGRWINAMQVLVGANASGKVAPTAKSATVVVDAVASHADPALSVKLVQQLQQASPSASKKDSRKRVSRSEQQGGSSALAAAALHGATAALQRTPQDSSALLRLLHLIEAFGDAGAKNQMALTTLCGVLLSSSPTSTALERGMFHKCVKICCGASTAAQLGGAGNAASLARLAAAQELWSNAVTLGMLALRSEVTAELDEDVDAWKKKALELLPLDSAKPTTSSATPAKPIVLPDTSSRISATDSKSDASNLTAEEALDRVLEGTWAPAQFIRYAGTRLETIAEEDDEAEVMKQVRTAAKEMWRTATRLAGAMPDALEGPDLQHIAVVCAMAGQLLPATRAICQLSTFHHKAASSDAVVTALLGCIAGSPASVLRESLVLITAANAACRGRTLRKLAHAVSAELGVKEEAEPSTEGTRQIPSSTSPTKSTSTPRGHHHQNNTGRFWTHEMKRAVAKHYLKLSKGAPQQRPNFQASTSTSEGQEAASGTQLFEDVAAAVRKQLETTAAASLTGEHVANLWYRHDGSIQGHLAALHRQGRRQRQLSAATANISTESGAAKAEAGLLAACAAEFGFATEEGLRRGLVGDHSRLMPRFNAKRSSVDEAALAPSELRRRYAKVTPRIAETLVARRRDGDRRAMLHNLATQDEVLALRVVHKTPGVADALVREAEAPNEKQSEVEPWQWHEVADKCFGRAVPPAVAAQLVRRLATSVVKFRQGQWSAAEEQELVNFVRSRGGKIPTRLRCSPSRTAGEIAAYWKMRSLVLDAGLNFTQAELEAIVQSAAVFSQLTSSTDEGAAMEVPTVEGHGSRDVEHLLLSGSRRLTEIYRRGAAPIAQPVATRSNMTVGVSRATLADFCNWDGSNTDGSPSCDDDSGLRQRTAQQLIRLQQAGHSGDGTTTAKGISPLVSQALELSCCPPTASQDPK